MARPSHMHDMLAAPRAAHPRRQPELCQDNSTPVRGRQPESPTVRQPTSSPGAEGDSLVSASTASPRSTAAPRLVRAKDREQWNAAVVAAPRSDLLQSWEWGEFLEDLGGWKPYRFLLLRDETPCAGVQILLRRVKGVPFLYAPRGPW